MHPKKTMNGWTEEQYIKAENTKKSKKKAKRDVAEKASMASQIKELQEKNILLENRIRELESQYQNDLKAMHDNFKQILNHIQISPFNEIKKITDEFRLFPKKYIDEKPMFGIMMDYAEKKITSPAFLSFCFMIHIMHNSTYKVLNDFLPMVPDSTCRQLLSPSRNLIKGCLLNIQGIHRILLKSFTSPVPITLAGDAASIKPYGEKGLNSVYTYMALSLFKHIKPTVVHICPTKCGSSSDEIVSKFDTIAKVIEDFGLQVKFIATDGDGAFDKLHENWFKKVKVVLSKNLTFEEKIAILKKYNKIPISDPFHLAKIGCAHLINHPVMLDNQTMKCINMMLFSDAVKLGPIMFDKSSIAAMKNNYMLNLFSWNSFVKLLAAQRFDGAMYVFPFMLLLNAIRSKNLNKKDRFNFLSIAIKHFYFYLRQVEKSDPKDFFTPTFHNKSSIGTLFGDRIFIIRSINTCVAIAVALDIGADYEFFWHYHVSERMMLNATIEK